ncbi:MAG TPA: leucine--tRNA ligase, partial [Blastocatellia bacterium]|nr:leucine--tRNA ligase [Blastocatellia bacterium]
MNEKYFPNEIEPKWQDRWAKQQTFHVEAEPGKPKFYCLEMLAYTSGKAHIGHLRNYSIGDALAWYKRLRGLNVLHPFGWDAFGQPAENAAIKEGIEPEKFTRDSIANMKRQLQRLGLSYDWAREIASCDPEYYRWNQWFFIRMWERGMLYRKLAPVNWCPKENISLSNEQAAGGVCWRCETPVIQKELLQWFARITDYADQLLRDLDKLEGGWPERVITMQRNWIGRSEGAEVTFQIDGLDDSVTVFTTRIDTIFGANAIVLAPEHPLVSKIAGTVGGATAKGAIEFAQRMKGQQHSGRELEELEKEGAFTGGYAINPFNGEKLPVWVANFVLMGYGTGAIMAVPSGDQRDFEFSRKYGVPFKQIKLTADGREIPADQLDAADEEWTVTVNTGEWTGLPSKEANAQMTAYAEQRGFGRAKVTYKLRDWGISRQRFWGTPIPMIHCGKCGIRPVPDDQLPVVLPKNVNLKVEGGSPLDHVPEFVNVKCPDCGGPARRDTDTMDTFVDSNWYYFRYCDPQNDQAPFDGDKIKYWLPVEQYIGGIEHAVLHLIYTRYWTKVMRDLGLVDFDEPVSRLLTQGMVCMETHYCPEHEWLFPAQVSDQGTCLICGKTAEKGRVEKMSKSRKNVVDPDQMITTYGADALRIFVLFAGPPEKDMEWTEGGIEGASKYLQRVWRMAFKWHDQILKAGGPEQAAAAGEGADAQELSDAQRKLRRRTHQIIRTITENMEERLHLNTCISSLMELTNEIYAFDQAVEKGGSSLETDARIVRHSFESLVKMLVPFAPHMAEELWEAFGHTQDLIESSWPVFDPELALEEQIEVPVQINGKLRGRVYVAASASEGEIKEAAMEEEKVKAALAGRDIVKVIVVPKKLVNVVV